MKYAFAAGAIFVAWAARGLRLPRWFVEELEDEASLRMFECSLDFEGVDVAGSPPAGKE